MPQCGDKDCPAGHSGVGFASVSQGPNTTHAKDSQNDFGFKINDADQCKTGSGKGQAKGHVGIVCGGLLTYKFTRGCCSHSGLRLKTNVSQRESHGKSSRKGKVSWHRFAPRFQVIIGQPASPPPFSRSQAGDSATCALTTTRCTRRWCFSSETVEAAEPGESRSVRRRGSAGVSCP